MKKIQYLFVTLLFFSVHAGAQEILTLRQVIDLALKNNFEIILAQNESEIAKNNNTTGNAGMLPVINAGFNNTNSINNSKIEYFDKPPRESSNAHSSSVSPSVEVNWTIFDGFNMFVNKKQLAAMARQGEITSRATIENTLTTVITTYYNLVQQKKTLAVINDALKFSLERKKLSESRLNIGSGSKLTLNQAEVDLNADSLAYLNQVLLIKNTKAELNHLLARDITADFDIADEIPVNYSLAYNEMFNKLMDQNPELQFSRLNMKLADLSLKGIKSAYYPVISVFGGYSYSQSKTQVGLYSSRNDLGPSYGLTASLNLFNGFYINRNVKNAKLEVQSSHVTFNQASSAVQESFYTLYNEYRNSLEIIRLENKNLLAARQNLVIAMEKYRLGAISDIDLRTIQLQQVEAENKLLNAEYQAKIAEIQLLAMAGELYSLYKVN